MNGTRIAHHFAEYRRPRFHRYEVAHPGFRMMRNVYPSARPPERFVYPKALRVIDMGTAWIGLAVIVGRYAYCVKWAHARIRFEDSQGPGVPIHDALPEWLRDNPDPADAATELTRHDQSHGHYEEEQ